MVQTPTLPIEGLAAAERILGANLLGPPAIAQTFGAPVEAILGTDETAGLGRLPFEPKVLERAAEFGALLILRMPRDQRGPLSIRGLHERFPEAFATKSMSEGVGYQLRSEWATLDQPFAEDVPDGGWRLVMTEPLRETRGRPYDQQDATLPRWATRLGVPPERVRRRSAVDAVYDVVVTFKARGARLLAGSWDWTRTPTPDGAFVTVGNFRDSGLEILAYSTAVRFAALGVCPEVV